MKTTCKGVLNSQEHQLISKFFDMSRTHRAVMDRELNATGVPRSQHQILMFVSEHPNASQKELAKLYGVSTATIAVSLKKLEKGGYIQRIVDENDNRFNRICITEKGKKVVADSVTLLRHREDRMFEGFSETELTMMGEMLERIKENLEQEFLSRTESEDK